MAGFSIEIAHDLPVIPGVFLQKYGLFMLFFDFFCNFLFEKDKKHVILNGVINKNHGKSITMNIFSCNYFYYFFSCFAFYFRKRGGVVAAVLN